MSNKQKYTKKRRTFNYSTNEKTNPKPCGQQSSKKYHHQNQLKETDVGITKYMNDLEGFSGIIKARFSDFQVNEINLDGEIAKLTDTSIPKDFIKTESKDCSSNVDESPINTIPQEKWDAIKAMVQSSEKQPVELDVTNLSKENRTEIHDCVKKIFGKRISSNTVTKDDKKIILFKKHDGTNGDNRFKWPEDKGEYAYFLVYKECADTLEACLKIASCLRISSSKVTYAGVKDKRAKTTQWFSIKKIEPWKLIVKTKYLRNIKIGNITFKDKPLKLGDLIGNKFRIAIRNVKGSDGLIEKSLESLKINGFINYYGLQRFGNDKEVPTFSIGLQLLLGNWKEACKIILKPTSSDQSDLDITKAKKVFYETEDAAKALEEFSGDKNTCIEYLLLAGLKKEHSNDFVNALANIPRNTRLLYIHSFQSLIWNLAASERIEKFGLNVVEGDLVLLSNDDKELEDTDELDVSEQKKPLVKCLTSDECSSYTVYDLVLPLPGYDVIYPENLKSFYKETLENFGLPLDMAKQKVQTYSVSGTYRKLLGQVKDLKWKIMHYNDPHYNLIRSDLEELKGFKEPENVIDGNYKALILELTLKSSSYATMVLREILKTDTASSFHANLNNYYVVDREKNTKLTDVQEEKDIEKDDDKIGLLGDKTRYELFKQIVFDSTESSLKRKHEDEDQNEKLAKVINKSENS